MLKHFVTVCSTLGVNNIIITEYRLHIDEQAKCFNYTSISRLCHRVSEHQTDLKTYLLPLVYAYNVQARSSIKVSAFSLAPSRTPSRSATVVPGRANLALDDDMAFLMYAKLELIRRATELRQEADRNWIWRKTLRKGLRSTWLLCPYPFHWQISFLDAASLTLGFRTMRLKLIK